MVQAKLAEGRAREAEQKLDGETHCVVYTEIHSGNVCWVRYFRYGEPQN